MSLEHEFPLESVSILLLVTKGITTNGAIGRYDRKVLQGSLRAPKVGAEASEPLVPADLPKLLQIEKQYEKINKVRAGGRVVLFQTVLFPLIL